MLAATRWPLAPRHLFYFDSVNFALALTSFDPARHQPQPPGYPLFVGLTRLLHTFVTAPETVFLLAGLLAGTGALLLLWMAGEEMFGRGAGAFAALLLLVHPVFWFGSLTNQVRMFIALASCAAAFTAWRAAQPAAGVRWLYTAAAAVGVCAGFRPLTLLLSLPLLAYAAWRGRRPLLQIMLACGVLAAVVLPWLMALLFTAGGPAEYARLIYAYSGQQFSGSSLAFGAGERAAWKMASSAVVWSFLGLLAWIWMVPAVRGEACRLRLRPALPFLAIWILPAFVFLAFIHVGDPDQTLYVVPATCLLGGFVLASARERFARGRTAATAAIVILATAASSYLFFSKGRGLARATSYQVIRSVNEQTSATFAAIRDLNGGGAVEIIAHDSFVTWRHLSYYFPDIPVLVVNGESPSHVWRVIQGQGSLAGSASTPVHVGTGKIVLLLPPDGRLRDRISREPGIRRRGPLLYLDAAPGRSLRVAGVTFVAAPLAARM